MVLKGHLTFSNSFIYTSNNRFPFGEMNVLKKVKIKLKKYVNFKSLRQFATLKMLKN